MRNTLLSLAFLLLASSSIAQRSLSDSVAEYRRGLTQKAMITLGAWSVANIASGLIIGTSTTGEAKYFWLMNSYWNFFNLGLAGLGYAGTLKMPGGLGFAGNLEAQHAIEKLYIFNGGLDLVYITGGFYLREHGLREAKQKDRDMFRGFGSSIILQGAYLLLMDCTMYALHHKNTRRLTHKLRQIELGAGPGGFAIRYTF
jgi:hypothetical protein